MVQLSRFLSLQAVRVWRKGLKGEGSPAESRSGIRDHGRHVPRFIRVEGRGNPAEVFDLILEVLCEFLITLRVLLSLLRVCRIS